MSLKLVQWSHFLHLFFFLQRRIEYDDRQEALLRALQQNVGQHVQMVGLAHWVELSAA